MSNSLDQKVKKLYPARSKREVELHALHEDILHCINNQSRRVKVERLVTKRNEAFMTVVDKNGDLIAFAGKTDDPSALVFSLEPYLEAMRTKNDKILTSERNCINSADDKVSEFQEPKATLLSRLPSIMTSSKTSSQRKHDYVIAKMKREKNEKQNEAAICLAKHKKQMELDELEENNRKRLVEATLQEFELLDSVSKGSQSETTASARSSIRSENAVQDWINTSERPTKDPTDCLSNNNGEAVEDHKTDISKHSFPKNCRGNYFLSNETLQQLEPQIVSRLLYTPLRLLHRLLNSPFHHSRSHRKETKIIHPKYFPTHNFKFCNPGDLKHQVCPRIIRPSEYAPDNKLIVSPEHQTPLFLLFRQQIIQPPQ